ncbi:MAG TPA: pseudouridine synthase [Cytophagaceae bacterium]
MRALNTSAKYFLVQKLRISNKEAIELITSERFKINGSPAQLNQAIHKEDEVTLDGRVLKKAEPLIYIAYYKPRNIECTLNTAIEGNLKHALNLEHELFPVGRLDKESEGLLLMTNDGAIYNKITHKNFKQEKEYLVKVNKALTGEALQCMRSGIEILGQVTLPAQVRRIDDYTFNIILTQGLNRQIRRMCYKVGYEVMELKDCE